MKFVDVVTNQLPGSLVVLIHNTAHLFVNQLGCFFTVLFTPYKVLSEKDLVILFSKGYPMPFAKKSDYPGLKKIADDFERELARMKKSGEYDKILLRWLKN